MEAIKRATTCCNDNEMEIFNSPDEMKSALKRQENKDKFLVTYNSNLYDISDFLPDHPGNASYSLKETAIWSKIDNDNEVNIVS